jgi:hypothetical protein
MFALHTRQLAKFVMWANSPTDVWERAVFEVNFGCFNELALGNQPHCRRDIIVNRAGSYTSGRIGAFNAPGCFVHSLFGGKGDLDFFKITHPESW